MVGVRGAGPWLATHAPFVGAIECAAHCAARVPGALHQTGHQAVAEGGGLALPSMIRLEQNQNNALTHTHKHTQARTHTHAHTHTPQSAVGPQDPLKLANRQVST